MFFGVKEDEDIKIGTETAKTDSEKTDLLLDFMGCADDVERIDMFRLGKPDDESDKPRPIKLTFSKSILQKATTFEVQLGAPVLQCLQRDSDIFPCSLMSGIS